MPPRRRSDGLIVVGDCLDSNSFAHNSQSEGWRRATTIPNVFSDAASGDAAFSAIVYLVLAVILADLSRDARMRLLVVAVGLFLSFLIGVTRVHLGVHYPSDVVAGWSLGGAWAILSIVSLGLLRAKRGS